MNAPLVLVLDDEPGITLLCQRLLTRNGFDVVAFTQPRQAIEALKTRRFDLLLVDIRMPEVDGFDVIAHAQRLQPDLAVLVMTGFGTVETAIRALRQGVDGLILKPFEGGEELVQAARQALVDKQNKRAAARIQTLRPLFAVTEALFSETDPHRLVDLILSAICDHVQCSRAAYYQEESGAWKCLGGRGTPIVSPEALVGVLGREDPLFESAIRLPVEGRSDPPVHEFLKQHDLASALFVPVRRREGRSLLFAGREDGQSPFHEADLELLQILGRQAVAAMENARLYAELREYVRRMEEAQQALVQAEKMAAMGRLSASIAHEINNPLQSVQNCLHLAGREDLPAERRQEYFRLAQLELERLQTTVKRMLDFYRPTRVAFQAVNVVALLQHVLGLVSKQLEERGIQVSTEWPDKVPAVRAVSGQIQQVFLNLILNAYDAMPSGGRLRITVRRKRDEVEILFADSGAGIPPGQERQIFEPFFSTKEGGTGLGLTVSYHIVTAHGGRLELVSTAAGLGACFCVAFPIAGGKDDQADDFDRG